MIKKGTRSRCRKKRDGMKLYSTLEVRKAIQTGRIVGNFGVI